MKEYDSDAAPLLERFSSQALNAPITSPLSSPTSSSSSGSGSLKQIALIFLAACVVGYLLIVILELSPVDSRAVFSRFSLSSSTDDCHVHVHDSVDDPFTTDERIDHLLYRSLKLAIDSGDDAQAAAVAKELALAAHSKAQLLPSTSTALTSKGGRRAGTTPGKRRWPPSTEEVEAVQSKVEERLVVEVRAKSEEQWARHYSGELRFQGYLHKPGVHLGHGYRLSADGCKDMDGQCSAEGKEAAAKLCDSLDKCRGFACNKERTDCQLRVAPLAHDGSRPQFDAYYKTATDLASADLRASLKREVELGLMAPGSAAAKDFDFSAACSPTFKCVISYGLYGDNPKYIEGALENVRLVPTVFPGWVARMYHDSSVPQASLDKLRAAGAELLLVDSAKEKMSGNIAGMFWRFLVAEDDSVQRFIVRDSDSRLNPREAAAVNEWIASGYSVHTIRDHPNHDRPLNGGLWGGVRGSVKHVRRLITESSLSGYGADLSFLVDKVWPSIQYDQMGHDAYTCEKYINSVGFPTKRPDDWQHVGQVFEGGKPRMFDITGFILNVETPLACRRDPTWKYG